ncbi:MAG: CPBP family intramembrane metalloprotease [Phycisphaerales bacterium]|nr:MAG: CPBP family intramembrane metalloprotease [Phycisphaerales bacterium]
MIETALVTIAALAAIKVLNVQRAQAMRWVLIPGILVGAALIPTWMARREFPRIGLNRNDAKLALATVGWVSAVVFPVVFLGLWILTRMGQPLPLQPALARQHDWAAWLVYQFLYVAVGEEVFFRGYVQANMTRFLGHRRWQSEAIRQALVLSLSAACFAAAHVIVQGRMVSLLTFLPGLLLAWLFLRTRSLLAPILFHGLANVTYGIMALTLA